MVESCNAYHEEIYSVSLEERINELRVYSISGLTVILIISSFMMLRRLKNRFHGLYTDYGKMLWIIVISQTISLIIGVSTFLLSPYDTSKGTIYGVNNRKSLLLDWIVQFFMMYIPLLL